MTGEAAAVLRGAAAHVLVDDVAHPSLDDATAHHVFRVLRTGDGEIVTVTDGAGHWRVCRARAGAIVPDGEVAFASPPAEPITVAVAIPKHDRPEWIVQKLTELGVDAIVLCHADRSVVRWEADRAAKHLAKLRAVAAAALQQSRRVWLPDVTGPLPSHEVLPGVAAAEPGGRPLAVTDRAVAIGPEGGWTAAELELAASTVSLGDTVLRVETAALAAAARLVAGRA